jgi:N utilization substance protein B
MPEESNPTDTKQQKKKKFLDNRHLFRQIIVQKLYQLNYQERSSEKIEQKLPDLLEDLELEDLSGKLRRKLNKSLEELDQIIEEITENQKQLDEMIQKYAPAWPIDQIDPVDLQILRLAIFEGFISEKVPQKVAVDEGIELARDFGGESNIKFISGVLGQIYSDLKNDQTEDE